MLKITITGVVQGVGFRPFIYRKAHDAGASGTVKNTGQGVEIITDINFVSAIVDWPPLAKVDSIDISTSDETRVEGFRILGSDSGVGNTMLSPDFFTCQDCLDELWDKDNRRYEYYFTTCTNCGPRFSMIEGTPYDRPMTSMSDFEMCDRCKKEYTDPMNRRYHAQTIACPDCGPRLKLIVKGEEVVHDDIDLVKEAVKLLKKGEIVAIKGVGGFHLACIAKKEVVGDLRIMLNRPYKPFALMVKGSKMASRYVEFNETEEEYLKSYQRPIVVLKKLKKQLEFVSELDSLGIIFPYTALHYLLFKHLKEPLVMTSANMPGEPIMIDEEIGENFLTHERRIVNRCDDSVLKVISGETTFIRRSRGFVPLPIYVKQTIEPCLALGAEMHNAIAAAKEDKVYLSQYLGNTSKKNTFRFLKDTIDKQLKLTGISPKRILCDLHPDFNTTKYASTLAEKYNAELIRVQHHEAHIAGVAFEHGLKEFVGIACDGMGYGHDGNIWGGEIIKFSKGEFTRIGQLEYQPMIGGDAATLDPKKMLFGILSQFMDIDALKKIGLFNEAVCNLLYNALEDNFNISQTSSTGRILDAVAAYLKLVDFATYEGRPAMILESVATDPIKIQPLVDDSGDLKILRTTTLFRSMTELRGQGKTRGEIAATVHHYLLDGLYSIAEAEGLPIVFSGGVGYNRIFTTELARRGVLMHKEVPCGDGGIAFGQVAYNVLSSES